MNARWQVDPEAGPQHLNCLDSNEMVRPVHLHKANEAETSVCGGRRLWEELDA
jgi:hypothetical protein